MALQTKRFKIRNEGFTCENCGGQVPPTSGTTPRNHCPFCLWSKHLDINPGDRANPCRGMMRPVGINTDSKKEYVIVHECVKCGAQLRSKSIRNDKNASDEFSAILELSTHPVR